jgi:hypothetical protein
MSSDLPMPDAALALQPACQCVIFGAFGDDQPGAYRQGR